MNLGLRYLEWLKYLFNLVTVGKTGCNFVTMEWDLLQSISTRYNSVSHKSLHECSPKFVCGQLQWAWTDLIIANCFQKICIRLDLTTAVLVYRYKCKYTSTLDLIKISCNELSALIYVKGFLVIIHLQM